MMWVSHLTPKWSSLGLEVLKIGNPRHNNQGKFSIKKNTLFDQLGEILLMKYLSDSLEVVAELPFAPGNITLTPDGRLILSLHQFYNPEMRVAELTKD